LVLLAVYQPHGHGKIDGLKGNTSAMVLCGSDGHHPMIWRPKLDMVSVDDQ
jgi:hypothetical protein